MLAFVEEHHLPAINKLQDEAVSVLLQVLYALHQGHVQFLMGDYKARIIEAHGQEAFPPRVSNRNKDRPPRVIQDIRAPARNSKQADDDSSEDGEVRAQDTLPTSSKEQRLGKDGRPVMTHAGHEFVHNTEQAQVDLLKEEDGESTDFGDSGSSPIYTSGGEEDKANTRVPSSTQMKATRSQEGPSTPSETTEAAGFGSDTSPRTESGGNDELSRAASRI